MTGRNSGCFGGGRPWVLPLLLLMLAAVLALVAYRPDRPVPTIAPGSSAGPAFVVQVIRPRLGLPVGGIVPPQLFGLEAHLGFDSQSVGADFGPIGRRWIELRAEGWDLLIVLDGEGEVDRETHLVFTFRFEEQLREVRCRPGDPTVGSLVTSVPNEDSELSGHFDVELARCEDAKTKEPLGWPPVPLLLHGSFDRMPLSPVERSEPTGGFAGRYRSCDRACIEVELQPDGVLVVERYGDLTAEGYRGSWEGLPEGRLLARLGGAASLGDPVPVLTGGSALAVQVVGPEGGQIPGAQVSVTCDAATWSLVSDTHGMVEIETCEAETVGLTVASEGLLPRSVELPTAPAVYSIELRGGEPEIEEEEWAITADGLLLPEGFILTPVDT